MSTLITSSSRTQRGLTSLLGRHASLSSSRTPMYVNAKKPTDWIVYSLLTLLMCLSGALRASDIKEVLPVTDRIIMIHFDDGHIDYGKLETDNIVYTSPLDTAAIYELFRYSISSGDDANYSSAQSPIHVGRKSKASDVNFLGAETGKKYILSHWVYLELPAAMEAGKTYTLDLPTLADNINSYTFTFEPTRLRSPTVHVNQIGFKPASVKYAYLSQWMGDFDNGGTVVDGKGTFDDYDGKRFDVVRTSDGVSVYNSTIAKRKDYETGEPQTTVGGGDGAPFWWVCECDYYQNYTYSDVLEADFSALTIPGEYKLVVADMGSSYTFQVEDDPYRKPLNKILKGLFYQRSGIAQLLPDGREYPRGHHPDDLGEDHYDYLGGWRWIDDADHQAGDKFSSTGKLPVWGWYHDAGDWDTYPQHTLVPLSLNLTYDMNPNHYADGDLDNRYRLSSGGSLIDEGNNGLPDILDEAAWLMKYHRRAKEVGQARGLTTGGVPGGYGGVDAGAIDGYPSWNDTRNLGFSAEDPHQTYVYAAEAAYYAANLKTLGGGSHPDAQEWIEQAEAAWTWADNNTLAGDNELWDGAVPKAKALAAVTLYKATGNPFYQTEFANVIVTDPQYIDGEESWGGANYWEISASVYALLPGNFPNLDQSFQTQVREKMQTVANDQYAGVAGQRGYRVAFDWRKAHILGMQSTPQVTALATALNVSNSDYFKDALHTTADYFLGGNPEHIVWVSQLGDNSVKYPFHPDSWYLYDYDSKVYSNDIIGGLIPYGSWQTPDFFGWGYQWTGDEDFSKTTAYPIYEYGTWPIAELRFENRYSIAGSEFTIWQNLAPAIIAYGALTEPGGGFYNNNAPTVSLSTTSVSSSGGTLTVTTSSDVVRVDYYYDFHFLGSSYDKNSGFAYQWIPSESLLDGNAFAVGDEILVTAVAYDNEGLQSNPSTEGSKNITITSGDTSSPNDNYLITVLSGADDDGEENSSKLVNLTSDDLDFRADNLSAMRFALDIPPRATITNATVGMIAKGATSGSNTLTFSIEATDNASPLSNSSANLSARSTTGSVSWSPGSWVDGETYFSTDLSGLIQLIVDRQGWTSGNYVVLQVSATGSNSNKRAARTFDYSGSSDQGPKLYINYSVGNSRGAASMGKSIVQEQPDVRLLKVYPNPSQGSVRVIMPQEGEVQVYNSVGKLIARQLLKTGESTLDLSDQSRGLYTISTTVQGQRYVRRLILR